MLEGPRPRDVVTVTRIDGLARSTFDLFAIVKQIVDAKAQFRSLAEPWADTGASTGRLMMAVLGRLGGCGARPYPHPHRRGPQPGAEARAAHGPQTEIDGGAAGRGPRTTRGGSYACGTRAQLRGGKEHDFETKRMKPARFFHYQRFVEAHLVSLLSAGQLKLSRPDSFNDPWDCRVHYQVPTDPKDRKRVLAYLIEINRKHYPSKSEAERRRVANDFMVNPSKLEAAFVQMDKEMYAALCRQYRIYCLTENPASPLMWGHYAASHTGICLEFDARRDPFPATEKVQYCTTYPARDLPTIGYEPLYHEVDPLVV